MRKNIVPAVLILLVASVAFLFFQNYKINQRIDELSKKEPVSITPVNPASNVANPAGASPFDKPNVDPLADQFPPSSGNMPMPTTMKFDKVFHNFGRINEGEVVKTVFKFTNKGK